MKKENSISDEEFERRFDNGESVLEYCDLTKVQSATFSQKRVNVDMPVWMISGLDREANRLGIARQAVIKSWIAEKLQQPIHRP
jgi:hypothetical protein